MPDISKCSGVGCPLRETCYRFVAPPTPYRQSYLLNPPIKPDGTCVMFWPIKNRRADDP